MLSERTRDRWATALRSGEFLQCRDSYISSIPSDDTVYRETFCCLGVRLEIDGLPIEEYELEAADEPMGMSQINFFVDLNDERRLTFAQIADVIDNLPQEEWK